MEVLESRLYTDRITFLKQSIYIMTPQIVLFLEFGVHQQRLSLFVFYFFYIQGCAVCFLDMTAEPTKWKEAVKFAVRTLHNFRMSFCFVLFCFSVDSLPSNLFLHLPCTPLFLRGICCPFCKVYNTTSSVLYMSSFFFIGMLSLC